MQRLRGPKIGSAILDGVFSPHGRLVAGAVNDGTARVWESLTGQQVGVMFGHSNPTTAVAFSPSGKAIATGSLDYRARTWQTNGKPVAILTGHTGRINAVAFSPDGRSVVTASEDGTARLWASGTEPDLRFAGSQPSMTAFAVSPDGKQVVVGDARGVARVREIGRRRVVASVRVRRRVTAVAFGPRGPVVATLPTLSLAVSPQTKRIARGLRNGSVTIRGAGRPPTTLPSRGPGVTAPGFKPNETLLASGDRVVVVRIWDLATRRVLRASRVTRPQSRA